MNFQEYLEKWFNFPHLWHVLTCCRAWLICVRETPPHCLHSLLDDFFNVGRPGFDLLVSTRFKSAAADLSRFSSITLFCLELDSSRCPSSNMSFNVYFGCRSAFFPRRDEVP